MSHLNQQMITVEHHEKSSFRGQKLSIKDTEERKETTSNLKATSGLAERESIDFDDAIVHRPPSKGIDEVIPIQAR